VRGAKRGLKGRAMVSPIPDDSPMFKAIIGDEVTGGFDYRQ
jgi:hypothetical protein